MLASMGCHEADPALIAALGRHLASRGGVQLALLFGSRARGTAAASSDVDLAVDAPGIALEQLSGDLSASLRVTVDVLALQGTTIPMLEALVREGIVVFEARSGLAARWRSRALIELETDLPWYRRMRDAWLGRVAERGFSDGE
jgi:predicted nucleotidyltransferase